MDFNKQFIPDFDSNKTWDSELDDKRGNNRYSTVVRGEVLGAKVAVRQFSPCWLSKHQEPQMMISKVGARPEGPLVAPPIELDNLPTGGYWDDNGMYLMPLSANASYTPDEGVNMPPPSRQIVDVTGMGGTKQKSGYEFHFAIHLMKGGFRESFLRGKDCFRNQNTNLINLRLGGLNSFLVVSLFVDPHHQRIPFKHKGHGKIHSEISLH